MAAGRPSEQQWFEQIVKSLLAIDDSFRSDVLSGRIAGMQAETAARFVAWICRGSRRKQRPGFNIAYQCLIDLCIASPRLDSEKRREIRKAAMEQGLAEVGFVSTG
jgi:hypothetical protein